MTLLSLSFLNRRIHREICIVSNHHDDILGKVLSSLALHKNIVDVLLLDGHLEALVLILEPRAKLNHEFAYVLVILHRLLIRIIVDVVQFQRRHDL